MFAYAPTHAPVDPPARARLRVIGRRRGAPSAVRAAGAYCAGLTLGLLGVAAVSAPTGDAGPPMLLATFAATGLAAALAVGRHHARR